MTTIPCPVCHGAATVDGAPCPRCHGSGEVVEHSSPACAIVACVCRLPVEPSLNLFPFPIDAPQGGAE